MLQHWQVITAVLGCLAQVVNATVALIALCLGRHRR